MVVWHNTVLQCGKKWTWPIKDTFLPRSNSEGQLNYPSEFECSRKVSFIGRVPGMILKFLNTSLKDRFHCKTTSRNLKAKCVMHNMSCSCIDWLTCMKLKFLF